jgi:hypothetical protein
MIFDADKIEQIKALAVAAGLHVPEKRGFLFFGVTEYEATLPRKDSPSDQVLADLQRMSEDGWVSDVIPLVIWLRNAANQTKLWPQRTAFLLQCADEAAKTPQPRGLFGLAKARPKDTTAGAPALPASPISLDAESKGSLVKTMGGCLAVDDIRTALQKCFGDLPNISDGLGGAPPDVRELAVQSIALVERARLTVVFLQFVVGTPRCNDELRAAALAIFPELETASRPFAAIVDAAADCFKKDATPIAELLGDQRLTKQLSLSVAELKCYKGLHEAIHQVKNSPPPAVPDDDNPANVREFKLRLRQYLAVLNTARVRSQGALDELPGDSGVRAAQQPGITLIGGYANRIEAALGRADIDAVAAALEDASRTIEPMLDEFNQQIVEMARRLLDGPLDLLRSAIAEILDQAGAQHPAVKAMDALHLALLTRVVQHTRWQEVDNSLFSLGGAFLSEPVSAFKKFTRRWGVARKQIPILTDSDSKIDTARLQALARKVDTALVEAEKSVTSAAGADKDVFNFVMLEPFDAFRFETQQQFLMIDSALKRNCAELVRIVPTA